MKTFEPFTKGSLDDVLRNQLEQTTSKVENEDQNYLLNVKEEDYIKHLISEFTIHTPIIDFDHPTVSPTEKMIPASRHPSAVFFMDDDEMGSSYKRQVIIYHFPFSGDINVLDYMPNPRIHWTQEFTYNDSPGEEEISFEVINFSNSPDEVKRQSDQTIGSLKTQLGWVLHR